MILMVRSVEKMLLMVVVELSWSVLNEESAHCKFCSSSSSSSKFIMSFGWCGMQVVLETQAHSSMTFWKVCNVVSANLSMVEWS